jgi:hypothetical protein
MMLPVYKGLNYSYCYETNTGHYLLFDNKFKSEAYLQGDDARIFREKIEQIDNLPPPKCNDGRITENLISGYL